MTADRDLLFGLIALQNGLIDQAQLVAAFQAWTRDTATTLADHLVARGVLDAEDRAAIESLLERHVRKHGGLAGSLAAVVIGSSNRERLAALGEPALEAALSLVGSDAGRTTSDDATASLCGQRFRPLRLHDRGGIGAVFVALDVELKREVALVRGRDRHADDPLWRRRFLREARIAGALQHPGIVPIYGLGEDGNGRPYYATRFIEGKSLKRATNEIHNDPALRSDRGARTLALHGLLRRFVDACNTIGYTHLRGVLHLDIRPDNIILGEHGETLVVAWGLALPLDCADSAIATAESAARSAWVSDDDEPLPGSVARTSAFISPEQTRGDVAAVGARSDIYSLGATLAYLLTGTPPFRGAAVEVIRKIQAGDLVWPRQVDPSIDPALEAVCLRAMAVEPGRRYATCRELAAEIERWMVDEPLEAYRESFVRRAWRLGTAALHRRGRRGQLAAGAGRCPDGWAAGPGRQEPAAR